jgi:hypothetical protein
MASKPLQMDAFSCEAGREPRNKKAVTRDTQWNAYKWHQKIKAAALMFILLVITAFLAMLFGLVWHDQPAQGREESSTTPTETRRT